MENEWLRRVVSYDDYFCYRISQIILDVSVQHTNLFRAGKILSQRKKSSFNGGKRYMEGILFVNVCNIFVCMLADKALLSILGKRQL